MDRESSSSGTAIRWYVVWHQAVRENADGGLTAVLSEQIEVDTPVSFGLVGYGSRFGGRFRWVT